MCVCVCVWGRGGSGRGSAEVGRERGGREEGGKGGRGSREVERWEEGGEGGWRGEACESEAWEESVHVNSFTTDWGELLTTCTHSITRIPYLYHTAIYTISLFMYQHGASFPC